MVLLLLALLVGVALIAVLSWTDISGWLRSNSTSVSQYGEIIKEKLSTGNYRVVAGVFNKASLRTANATWTAKELDGTLRDRFRQTNRIVVDV